MPTLTGEQARATADAATTNTRAAMAGPHGSPDSEAAREHAVDIEMRAHADLDAEAAAQLDADLAAAETGPEVTGPAADAARAALAAETLAWFRTGPQAETEAEAG